jgi:hypothetical protein
MASKRYSIYIFTDSFITGKDIHFYASVNNGIAWYKGHAYNVVLGLDGKTYYNAEFLPETPYEVVEQSIQEYLANEK